MNMILYLSMMKIELYYYNKKHFGVKFFLKKNPHSLD